MRLLEKDRNPLALESLLQRKERLTASRPPQGQDQGDLGVFRAEVAGCPLLNLPLQQHVRQVPEAELLPRGRAEENGGVDHLRVHKPERLQVALQRMIDKDVDQQEQAELVVFESGVNLLEHPC